MSSTIYEYVSPIDKVIDFITNELNIEITEKNKELIMDKFYPDIKNNIFWFFYIDDEEYEGMITKEEYDIIKTLSPETDIYFNGLSKDGDYCKLKDIKFQYKIDTLKEMYDKGDYYYIEQHSEQFDLVSFLCANDIITYEHFLEFEKNI